MRRDLIFNTTFIDQRMREGLHRSGWQYVLDSIESRNTIDDPARREKEEENEILLDTYLDRTFCWKSNSQLPYSRPWMGIVHHTDSNFSSNSSWKLIGNPLFIRSLPHCKGIITLSKSLRDWYANILSGLGSDVRVFSLHHPTLLDVPKWRSPDRLVQIGSWYRNPFTIYTLDSPLPKVVLKGKYMDGILPEDSAWGRYCNDHFQFQVETLSHLADDEYDELLSTSVVFLHLVDAAAVNTIIECIARSTPIVVNRLPATIEYLGVDYPLFYDDPAQIPWERVREAHHYLERMNKDFISIESFITRLNSLPVDE